MWPFPKSKDIEEASKASSQEQFEQAAQRRREASEELKKYIEKIGPFDELAEFLRGQK